MDMDRIFQSCSDNSVFLEINGFPEKSDLPFDLVRRARGYNVKFMLGSDSKDTEELRYLKFATAIARRGWLQKEMVVNSYPYSRVLSEIQRVRHWVR